MARHLNIAGVDRWNDYRKGTMNIDQVLTYQVDVCSFRIKGEKPVEGEEVIVEDDVLGRLFGGIIDQVESVPQTTDISRTWQVNCQDYTYLLNRRLVVETYEAKTADWIFCDIVSKYCPGFTVNGVQAEAPTVEYLIFDYVTVSEAFRQLCDYIGWHWQPDYFKDLQFFSAENLASPAPMILVPGGQFRFGKHTIDTQGLRNRVYVRGGTMLSDPQTVEWKADGVARIWNIPFGPHDIAYSGQAGKIGVGGVAKSIGVEHVDDEATKDYLLNYQEKYIRCASGTTTPVSGTTISLQAKQDIDVITMVEDLASQSAIAAVQGGDGVYEHVITDDSLVTIEAAEAAGNADLRDYANPHVKGSFETEVSGWRPGQLVSIQLSDRRVNGTYLVQKVTIIPAASNMWTFRVEYGGRLLGIADFLKALVSAQQKKKLNETAILHKFVYGSDQVGVTDELIFTPRSLPYICGDSDAICGLVVVSNE